MKGLLLKLIACSFFQWCIVNHAIAQQLDYDSMREQMLEKIREDTKMTAYSTGITVLSEPVLQAMTNVPRHIFVAEEYVSYSYQNRPLPIEKGQTISQPFIVALMTELLSLEADDKVLEIGTGSGYQAAVLAEIVKQVFSIEIIPELGHSATQRLKALGYGNVKVSIGDGYQGMPEEAPFDKIIVTAAAKSIPPPLIEQLTPGGILVIPVGSQGETQYLTLLKKDQQGEIVTTRVLAVAFVPLTRNHQ